MTNLSPAAQAVMHTYEDWLELPVANQRYGPLAAALRAAADQVIPEVTLLGSDYEEIALQEARKEILAIAAELEGAGAE